MMKIEGKHIFSVFEISSFIKENIEANPYFSNVLLKGEISNFSFSHGKHMYFSLKDEQALIKAVMFSYDNTKLNFLPKDGDEVIVQGDVRVYLKTGIYQIVVHQMEEVGAGKKLQALEALKRKLFIEGLFDESKKMKIKEIPSNIALICAPKSAALKDLIFNINRRYPLVDIYVFPSLVQGEDAPKSLIKALDKAYHFLPQIDTIIVARGGGSSEDLDAFNDEALVRFAAKRNIPLISAVGHEIDLSLLDLVSDVRVSTPTAAAEKAVPDKEDILFDLDQKRNLLTKNIQNRILKLKYQISSYKNLDFFKAPESMYVKTLAKLDNVKTTIVNLMHYRLDKIKTALNNYRLRLEASHPKQVLKRGFAIVESKDSLITSVKNVKIKDTLRITLKDGTLISEVVRKE